MATASAHIAKIIDLIGAAQCLGAKDHRCESGPLIVRSRGLLQHLAGYGFQVNWKQFVMPHFAGASPQETLLQIEEFCARLQRYVKKATLSDHFIAVIGGDHSCAIGTWSGVYEAIKTKGRLGLIWVDAHMDSHTFETSHSGAVHGMPLAALLGYGDPRLTQVGGASPKLNPADVCLVGVRSFEDEEKSFLEQLGVRIFYMSEVKQRGLAAVMEEAAAHVSRNTFGFGLSIDLDALDPRDAPGVGSPEPNGIPAENLISALASFKTRGDLLGVEVVEYNPCRDRNGRTAEVVIELLDAVV